MATVNEIKSALTDLGISFPTDALKKDLKALLKEAQKNPPQDPPQEDPAGPAQPADSTPQPRQKKPKVRKTKKKFMSIKQASLADCNKFAAKMRADLADAEKAKRLEDARKLVESEDSKK